jgi:hypothetical protein
MSTFAASSEFVATSRRLSQELRFDSTPEESVHQRVHHAEGDEMRRS